MDHLITRKTNITLTIQNSDLLLLRPEQSYQTAQEVIVMVLERYISRIENAQYDDPNKLLEAINAAYADVEE